MFSYQQECAKYLYWEAHICCVAIALLTSKVWQQVRLGCGVNLEMLCYVMVSAYALPRNVDPLYPLNVALIIFQRQF